MKKISEKLAQKFAEERFNSLNDWRVHWNYIHSKNMIKAIKELTDNSSIIDKLIPLAWVHDIGKIKGNEYHAKNSIEILEEEFKLDDIDRDCILNHGSGDIPKTDEGKIFRYADGISLFYPETVLYWFWAEANEDKTPFLEVKEKFDKQYSKYKEAYSDSKKVSEILNKKYSLLFKE